MIAMLVPGIRVVIVIRFAMPFIMQNGAGAKLPLKMKLREKYSFIGVLKKFSPLAVESMRALKLRQLNYYHKTLRAIVLVKDLVANK
ncbi:hypothetical protein ACJJIF_15065 [Microbulbifer sp. SSSA002]|uniref:hypothetical protein n=1 Tax=Microbulbifer sp. SSSA002 TaxID=3243376 RepID=UPI0040391D80